MSEKGGQGCLTAAFEMSPESSVTLPSVAAAQFSIEGTTLSGVDFEIAGSGYRMSLLKKRVATGESNLYVINVRWHIIYQEYVLMSLSNLTNPYWFMIM